MPFLLYMNKIMFEGPNLYPYNVKIALNQCKIDTEDNFLL